MEELASVSPPFPEVPGDEFYIFRAACRRLLDGAAFPRVDEVHQQSQHDTDVWLQVQLRSQRRPQPVPMIFDTNVELTEREPAQPTLADVGAFLQQLTATSSCAAETLVRLRGAQAAFFLHGFLLSLQLGSGTHPGPADLRPTMDPSVADRLRGLCTTRLTAAMTLALVTEMTSAQLCQLNLPISQPMPTPCGPTTVGLPFLHMLAAWSGRTCWNAPRSGADLPIRCLLAATAVGSTPRP